ncbi:MAG: biopolymer transporter ExbD [Breznakibacter sp.]
MPKVKIPRKSTAQDMTAMSDVAFLLLTFFILTSNFAQKDPVSVDTPSSISEIKIPETNVMMVLVDASGKIFWGIDKQEDRMNVLEKMGEIYQINFSDKELKEFSLVNRFGLPIQMMKQYLAMPAEMRDLPQNALGIPCDSLDNQFQNWVSVAKSVNKDLRIAIKGDKLTTYPDIKKVMDSLQEIKENRYNLITSLEAGADFNL